MSAFSIAKPVEVFVADQGYPNFRIPSLMAMPDGTLIAIAEARTKDDPGDGGMIDLVCRRSTDGGANWSPVDVIEHFPGGSVSNPTAVLDESTGRAWILYNRWGPSAGEHNSQPGTMDNSAWARYTDDAGKSWSIAIDITSQVKEVAQWNSMTFGPGSGIQARNGRLIVPAYRWMNGPNSFAVFSDDHGTTWQRGELLPGGNLSNECQVVELRDRRILIDARAASDDHPTRIQALSADLGRTWSSPADGQKAPAIKGSIGRVMMGRQDCIIWIGPRGPGRANLVARLSRDNGETFPEEHLLHAGYAGYSDIRLLAGGEIGVLWEINEGRSIVYSHFNYSHSAIIGYP